MLAIAVQRAFDDPWNIVQRRRQLAASNPDGPALPWQCKAAERIVLWSRQSKMTGWVSSGPLGNNASGWISPGGGCLALRISRTDDADPSDPGINWSSGRTLPRVDGERSRKAAFTFPWCMFRENWRVMFSSSSVAWLDFERWANSFWMIWPSWSSSSNFPSIHRSIRRSKHLLDLGGIQKDAGIAIASLAWPSWPEVPPFP